MVELEGVRTIDSSNEKAPVAIISVRAEGVTVHDLPIFRTESGGLRPGRATHEESFQDKLTGELRTVRRTTGELSVMAWLQVLPALREHLAPSTGVEEPSDV